MTAKHELPGEFELIRMINKKFHRSPDQVNQPFETDAELLAWRGGLLAFTMDEFSEEEEYIGTMDPFLLGWNIAVGVISDLLAVGAAPLFYSHACVLSNRFTGSYRDRFFEGINRAVTEAGAYLIGGDLGISDVWRYTGAAFGEVEQSRVRKRIGIEPTDSLYVTGMLGDGNRAALLNFLSGNDGCAVQQFPPEYRTTRFELRLAESNRIGSYSTVCMDTSDGLIRTLSTLTGLNPCALVIDPGLIPYDQISVSVMEMLDMPPEALLFGSAGEYELFFTVPAYAEAALIEENRGRLQLRKIGRAVPGMGLYFIRSGHDLDSLNDTDTDAFLADGNTCISLASVDLDPRKMEDTGRYIEVLLKTVKDLFYQD